MFCVRSRSKSEQAPMINSEVNATGNTFSQLNPLTHLWRAFLWFSNCEAIPLQLAVRRLVCGCGLPFYDYKMKL